jgi:hypothetical protein
MTRVRPRPALIVVISTALLLASCATQPPPISLFSYEPPGFFSGLLHGFLIVFSLIGSLFTKYRVYAYPNSGFFYDLGFFLGAAAFLGGGGHKASRR